MNREINKQNQTWQIGSNTKKHKSEEESQY